MVGQLRRSAIAAGRDGIRSAVGCVIVIGAAIGFKTNGKEPFGCVERRGSCCPWERSGKSGAAKLSAFVSKCEDREIENGRWVAWSGSAFSA